MYEVMLITGTSGGIGGYLADYYDSLRYTVVGCSRTKYRSEYRSLVVDITDKEQVDTMFKFIRMNYGKLSYLINNAGTASMNHFMTTPLETVEKIMDLNFNALFYVTQQASKLMINNKFGRIVNIVSIAAPLNMEGESIYAASKSAVESLTKTLAKELASYNITVNAVGPTPIDTNLIKGVPDNKIQLILRAQAINRKGTCEDVSNVIDFFIKPESDFITGQVVYLGGIS